MLDRVPDFVLLMRKVLLGRFHANFHFRNSSSDVRLLSFIAQWALAFATKLSLNGVVAFTVIG